MAGTFEVERRIEVDASAAALYERIADFHRWSAWSPFEDLDPDMDRKFEGAESGVGAVYEWSGDMKAGAGRMEMLEAVPEERVVIDQRNFKPLKTQAKVTFSLERSGDATTVTWSMTGETTALTRVMGVFKSMDKMIGPVFEKGLAKLKKDAEAA